MKIVRIRYLTLLPLRQDLLRVFPNWDGTAEDIADNLKKRHCKIKVKRNATTGVLIHADVYLLVKDTFTLPLWVQGTLVLSNVEPYEHGWLGHETPVPDPPYEEPEENIS
jgi:hypothetical protein